MSTLPTKAEFLSVQPNTKSCQQFWFSRDLLSLLVTHLTVKECFSRLPVLSKWHRSFMNGECSNLTFLREWVRFNHGLSVMTSPHCSKVVNIIQSFDHLIDLIFIALKDSHHESTGLSLSTILHHFYDCTLPMPDFEIPELHSSVCYIRAFQIDTRTILLKECTQNKRRIWPLLRSNSEFDPSDEPFVPFVIEIVGSPLLFDPRQRDVATLKDKASHVLQKLVKLYPDICSVLGSVDALRFAFKTSQSLVTRNLCASALLRLLAAMWKRPSVTKPILDSDFLESLISDVETSGCDVFEDAIYGFRKVCECKNLSVSEANASQLVRFCVAVMKDTKPGRMFRIIIDCFYLLARDLIRKRVSMFVNSGMFELLSKYKKEWKRLHAFFDIRLLTILCLVGWHGTLNDFDQVKKQFPIMTMIEDILNDKRESKTCLPWMYGHCLPILFRDRYTLNEYFKHSHLVVKMIFVGIDSLRTDEQDAKLAESVLICTKQMIRNCDIYEHIPVLIAEGIWDLLSECVMCRMTEKVLLGMLECVCDLLDVIEKIGDQSGMSYVDAKEICNTRGISGSIYGFCRMRFYSASSLKKSPLDSNEYPTLMTHFPGVKPFLLK